MIRFYISESFKSIKRAKLASFITVITLSISIAFIAVSFSLLFLSNRIENSWKNEIKINTFIQDSVSSKQLSKIKNQINEFSEVNAIKYFSKKDAYNKFIKMTGNDFKKILETNPLPRSFAINFKSSINKEKIENIIAKLKNIDGIEDVIYDYNLTFTLLEYISSMKIIVFVLTIIFTLISFYLLFSTSRLIISQRMHEYSTMKLVGAKLSAIKIPLLLTGMILGLISAVFCILGFNIFYLIFKSIYPSFIIDNYLYLIDIAFAMLGLFLGPIGIGFYTKKLSLKIDHFE
jgi:cell division transport system permease protein